MKRVARAAPDLAGLDEQAEHAIVVVAFIVTVGTLSLQGLTLPWLIRALGVVDDSEAKEDARQLAAVRARSREAGKAYLRSMRREWAHEHGEDRLPAFDAFARRLVRVESDAESAQPPRWMPKSWRSTRGSRTAERHAAPACGGPWHPTPGQPCTGRFGWPAQAATSSSASRSAASTSRRAL